MVCQDARLGHTILVPGVLHWNGVEILDWYLSAKAEA